MLKEPYKSPLPSKVNYPEVSDQEDINTVAFDPMGLSYKENPSKSYRWHPFKLEITADDTPDPGTVINDQAHYLQLGGMLFVMYNFEKTDGGTDGSGDYIFSMPPGFKVDTNVIPIIPSAAFSAPFTCLGECRAYDYNESLGYGFIYPCSETGLIMRVQEGDLGAYKNVSSADYNLSQKNVHYSFSAQIPVKV